MTLPSDPIQQIPTYSAALAAYEKLPVGAGAVRQRRRRGSQRNRSHPGTRTPAFEQSFPSFPIPGTVAQTWYFGAGGSLATSPDPAPEI